MNERSFDEMITYFNRRVADMDINQDYKMELLGMVTALGFKHEKSVQPERKKGEWRTFKNSCTIQCNQCLSKMTSLCDITLPNFCPYCGADMRCGDTE